MSSDSGEHAKKRRVDSGGGAALSVGQGEREGDDGLAGELMSMMNKLLDQNRLQMASMDRMEGKIASLEGKIDRMEGEMKDIRVEMGRGFDNVKNRFVDVEDKQNYHEVMLESQKWEYPAPFPNVPDNSAEKHLLDQIKEQTCDMRYGKWNAIAVEIDGQNLDYDVAFLPHWKEFAGALEEYQYALKCLPKGKDTAFQLNAVQLPKTVLDLLSDALKSTHFKSIYLCDNRFGRDGIKFALNYFQNNHKLEEFRLRHNPIDHEDDIDQLIDIIKVHPSINTLELDHCFDDEIDGHKILCSIMTAGANKLKSIDLCSNEILTGANFLATNPILEQLVLCDNLLDDTDANAIATALKRNTNLRCLDITNNDDITNPGWDALRKAEFDPTSLNSAAESNHTCFIAGASEYNGDDPDTWDEMTPFVPAAVRQKKIYSVLSSRNRECSNVQSMDDVPVEFLPDMLVSIQQYSEYHIGDKAPPKRNDDAKALSVMYEILRFWNEAFSVYESLSSF